jgi:predicted GIY-YIG superfamily endonuclease
VKLAYAEPHETEQHAVSREMQIKRWSRAKKEALINGNTPLLRLLAKRKQARAPA